MGVELCWSSKDAAVRNADNLKQNPPNLNLREGSSVSEDCRLIHGDNLQVAAALLPTHAGKIDLIYIDPPFAVGLDFRAKIRTSSGRVSVPAYADRWKRGREGYLDMIHSRLLIFHQLLSDTGSIMVHCDWRVVHHLRSLLDEVFGMENFQNQICWVYGQTARGAKAISRQFPRNHDYLIWYTKSSSSTFNGDRFERVFSEKEARSRGFRMDEDGRWFKTSPRGDYSDKSIERLKAEGRIHRTKNDKIRIKYFLPTRKGKVVESLPVGDVWTDIADAMHMPRREQTGYATQKPRALLNRVIKACTNEGDLVADFFCGSGTTLLSANHLNRRWIGCDSGELAVHTARKSLLTEGVNFSIEELKPRQYLQVAVKAEITRSLKGGNICSLVLPTSWPKGPSGLDFPPSEWIDHWSVGHYQSGNSFTKLWHSSSASGLQLDSPPLDKSDQDLWVKIFDVLGRECLIKAELKKPQP